MPALKSQNLHLNGIIVSKKYKELAENLQRSYVSSHWTAMKNLKKSLLDVAVRPNFLNICNLPISHFPNIRKIRVKVGPKTNYFSYFMSSCTNRIVVFNIFFHLYLANQETNKIVCAIFFFSNIFWIIYF